MCFTPSHIRTSTATQLIVVPRSRQENIRILPLAVLNCQARVRTLSHSKSLPAPSLSLCVSVCLLVCPSEVDRTLFLHGLTPELSKRLFVIPDHPPNFYTPQYRIRYRNEPLILIPRRTPAKHRNLLLAVVSFCVLWTFKTR